MDPDIWIPPSPAYFMLESCDGMNPDKNWPPHPNSHVSDLKAVMIWIPIIPKQQHNKPQQSKQTTTKNACFKLESCDDMDPDNNLSHPPPPPHHHHHHHPRMPEAWKLWEYDMDPDNNCPLPQPHPRCRRVESCDDMDPWRRVRGGVWPGKRRVADGGAGERGGGDHQLPAGDAGLAEHPGWGQPRQLRTLGPEDGHRVGQGQHCCLWRRPKPGGYIIYRESECLTSSSLLRKRLFWGIIFF